MLLLNFDSLLYAYFFLCLYAVERAIFALTFMRGMKACRSSWLTYIPFLSYILLCLIAIIEFSLSAEKILNLIISIAGISILTLGVFLRYQAVWAFSAKEQTWNSHIDADNVDVLVTAGIYRFLRHPYYLSVMIELCGIALALNSFITMILVFLIQFPLLCKRTKDEDSALEKKFGEQYTLYKKRTRAVLPNWSIK